MHGHKIRWYAGDCNTHYLQSNGAPPPLVEGRPPVPRQRLSAEAATRLWGSPWRRILQQPLAAPCKPCRGRKRRNRDICDFCGGSGRAMVHIIGHVKLGALQIALAERFFQELDLGASSLRSSQTDPATARRRALFRRGVPLVPSSIWLMRLEEPAALDGGGLWRDEASQP